MPANSHLATATPEQLEQDALTLERQLTDLAGPLTTAAFTRAADLLRAVAKMQRVGSTVGLRVSIGADATAIATDDDLTLLVNDTTAAALAALLETDR